MVIIFLIIIVSMHDLLPQEHLEIAATSCVSNLRSGVLGIVFN